ncbi:MAG: NAD(P)-dependent oxidoreductase [Burkholderiales bacterium]|nr:NAD(P)-dependent oxidoreductase [Burkholderiales bacterium]
MASLTIGMVGLGNLGNPIAARLAGEFPVLGFDTAAGSAAAPAGVTAADGVESLARRTDIVALCLPVPEAVLSTIERIAAVPRAQRKVRIIVDLSTIGVPTAERSAELARAAGLLYVDSPVSGGVPRARNGTLAIMCAGEPAAIEAAGPLQRRIAARIFVMGERSGMGQAMKLANNIISAAALAATSEALIFGEQVGLDPAQMIDVINVSTGRTEVSEVKFVQTILPRRYSGAYARVMGKDVSLFLESARGAGIATPVAARTGDVWKAFVDDAPLKDFQYIYEYLRERAGVAR